MDIQQAFVKGRLPQTGKVAAISSRVGIGRADPLGRALSHE